MTDWERPLGCVDEAHEAHTHMYIPSFLARVSSFSFVNSGGILLVVYLLPTEYAASAHRLRLRLRLTSLRVIL